MADVDEEKGGQTAEAIIAAGGTASFLRVDVSRAADVEAMVATAVERYGRRLDCAVNNAAYVAAKHGVLGLTKRVPAKVVLNAFTTGVPAGRAAGPPRRR